jgi:hypothetical protein
MPRSRNVTTKKQVNSIIGFTAMDVFAEHIHRGKTDHLILDRFGDKSYQCSRDSA